METLIELASVRVKKLPDGFYFIVGDSASPTETSVLHRTEGLSWTIGSSSPIKDDDWEDQIQFVPIPLPAGITA